MQRYGRIRCWCQSWRPITRLGCCSSLAEIGQRCRDRGVLFHTDAAQALGKMPLNVEAMKIDLMSITAHKLYGPKGIGALYVRRKNPRVQLAPQLHGGGHERGMRSGTLYTPQIVGFAEAVRLAQTELETEQKRLRELRDRLWQQLCNLLGIQLNGHLTQRLAGNLNISVAGVDGQALLLGLRSQVAVSSGAACSSASTAPSHVLKALGHSDALAYASLRFGIGRFNTEAEIDTVAQVTRESVIALRQTDERNDGGSVTVPETTARDALR
jgi:cysteine desulfurase